MFALTQKEKKKSQLIIATFVAMTAYLVFFSATGTGLWACPIRTVTGLYCFRCGMTRSLSAFIRLDLVESFRMHALGPAFFIGFAAMALTHSVELIQNKRLSGIPKQVRKYENWVWMAFGISVVIFGVWRLIDHPHGY